ILVKYEDAAERMDKLFETKTSGERKIIEDVSCDAQAASTQIMKEKLEEQVERQEEAICTVKIDKMTASGSGGNGDGSSTSNFISNLFKSLPPLQDISDMAGVQLPEYLGKVKGQTTVPAESSETPEAAKDNPKA